LTHAGGSQSIGRDPNKGRERFKKWVAPRRSKPELCIFNVTIACLFRSVA